MDYVAKAIGAVIGFLPRMLTWVLLQNSAESTLSSFANVSMFIAPTARWVYMGWMLAPYVLLAIAALLQKKGFLRDCLILVPSMVLACASYAVYFQYIPPTPELADAKIFLWAPIVQLLWAAIWVYVAFVRSAELLERFDR